MKITFTADKVKVKTGHRIDNSGEVTFIVGEYELDNIKDLVNVVDKEIKVDITISNEYKQ